MARYTELTDEQKRELIFTPEERSQLEEAKKRPIEYDDDCPPVTAEKAVKVRRVNPVGEVRRA